MIKPRYIASSVYVGAALCTLVPMFASAQTTFRHPLDTQLSIYNSSAFFDNDPGASWRDYKCGTQSRNLHDGVDFNANMYTDVFAGAAGNIYRRENICDNFGNLTSTCGDGYGNHYRIDHQGNNSDGVGLASMYAHLEKESITTTVGTAVSCGQKIARSAQSGKADGPHVHFTIRTNGLDANTKVDPFKGTSSACNTSPGYWTAVNGAVPTTQCQYGPIGVSNVAVTNPTGSSLQINFKDNAFDETGISIERKIMSASAWVLLGSFSALSGAQSWNWQDTGLSSNQTYCYRLRAQNAQGTSMYSNEACGTTSSVFLPPAPSNVSVANPTTASLRVNFTDNATNETKILLERKIGVSGAWTQIMDFGVLNATGSWYWDNTGLSANTTYCYRLRAQSGAGYSGYSNEACSTTSDTNPSVPAAPSNVSVTNPTINSLRVNFTDNATNETGIILERKIGTGGGWVSFASFSALSGTGNWYWTNTGLSSRTTYCYRLKAVNGNINSGYSNESCGITQ